MLTGKRFRISLCFVAAVAALAAGCGAGITTAPSSAAPTPTSLAISGVGATVTVGDTATLAATATHSDGSTLTVTGVAAWESSNAAIATVSASGAAAFLAAGEVDIKASYKGVSHSIHVSVASPAPRITAIVVGGVGATALAGQTASLTAFAAFSDDTTVDVTSSARWESSNTTVATITAPGKVTFKAGGVVDLRATYSEVSGVIQVAVSVPPPPPPPPDDPTGPPPPPADVSAFYGRFSVGLSITGQSCVPPIVMAPSATLVLSGNPEGTNAIGTLTERGVARPYYGRMEADGSFRGFFAGLVPATGSDIFTSQHTADGSLSARVVGGNVTGSENLRFHDAACAGGFLNTSFSGGR